MKLRNHLQNKWSGFKRRQHGYAAMGMVALLGMTALLGLMHVFRIGMRSHEAQIRNQIKVDHRQKEDAILRALVSIAPNKAVLAMQQDSTGSAATLGWNQIFTEAIDAAKAETALDSAVVSSFGIANLINANTGDIAGLAPADFVSTIAGSGTLAGEGHTGNAGLLGSSVAGKLPTPLVYNAAVAAADNGPIITSEKAYAAPDVALFPDFNVIDYPDIRFGFVDQSGTFIAKRNWWAFSMEFGSGLTVTNNTGTASTAIPTVTKNYVLSIYEVPSQLAVSAGTNLTLEGGAWATANIEGGVFGKEVAADGLILTGTSASISAVRDIDLGGGATVGTQNVTNGFDDLGTRETRWAASGGDTYGASVAGNSGRVAIMPLSEGNDFIRRDATAVTNSLSPTGWDVYARGSRQCAMGLEVISVAGGGENRPTAVRFYYTTAAGGTTSVIFQPEDDDPDVLAEDDQSWQNNIIGGGVQTWENYNRDRFLWDHDGDDPDGDGEDALGNDATARVSSVIPFYFEYLKQDDVPVLTIKLDRFPDFLEHLAIRGNPAAATVAVNNSLAIWSSVAAPSIPAAAGDMGVVIRDADDLTQSELDGYTPQGGFTTGFSLVTDHLLYLVGEINQVSTAPPAGAVLPAGVDYYPPLSIFASEKRFGTADTGVGDVSIDGQLTSLQEDDGTVVNPLDLKSGTVAGAVGTASISANLSQITSPAQLPPVNKMTWLVVIEEIHPD